MNEIIMKKTEEFISQICDFLNLKEEEFGWELEQLRSKGWARWGGGTVEVTVAEILYVLTVLTKPTHCLEAGTAWAYSTAHIAEALKDNKKENSFVSLDIDSANILVARQYLSQKNLDVKIEHRSSTIPLKLNHNLDMIFIDSSHDYKSTKKEWSWMYPLLFKNKGFALFHDAYTDSYGVKKFLKELEEKGHKLLILDTQPNTGLGIIKLANEFIQPEIMEDDQLDEWLYE